MPIPTCPIRMVALDLDGTLINRRHQITPRTLEAVSAAIRRGVIVLPATGRGLSGVPLPVAAIPGVRYALTTNGAAVWDMGPDPAAAIYSRYGDPAGRPTAEPVCLLHRPLPAATAWEAFRRFCRFEGDLTIFSDGHTIKSAAGLEWMLARARTARSTEASQQQDGRFTIVPDLTAWMDAHAHQVEKFCMFFAGPDQAQAARTVFDPLEGVEVVQGAPDNLEITAAGVDKGEALLALGRQLGIPREQILAVGDSENDRAMLEKAGTAAVMANGIPQIRALADLVSENDCDHDGVAELFERLKI